VTIFEKILAGDVPSYKVAESEKCLAFLDVFPLKEGHVLVIPKSPIDYIFDIDNQDLSDLHLFSKKVAIAMKSVLSCNRIGLAVIGLEVPHAHIHLVPIDSVEDINFSKPKIEVDSNRMLEISLAISQAFQKLD
jgi:histidine triad (HIT) family protein|tara:strand:+ start:543 stop:944 length:402 start_codon:yes stop_codon:yes gene_type:complete